MSVSWDHTTGCVFPARGTLTVGVVEYRPLAIGDHNLALVQANQSHPHRFLSFFLLCCAPRSMMVFGATAAEATADDVDLGLPPARRMSSSADGPLGNGRRRERAREGGSSSAAAAVAVLEPVVLVLGQFQGVVVLDMGVVMVSLFAVLLLFACLRALGD